MTQEKTTNNDSGIEIGDVLVYGSFLQWEEWVVRDEFYNGIFGYYQVETRNPLTGEVRMWPVDMPEQEGWTKIPRDDYNGDADIDSELSEKEASS
jgi:hypothetical protein